MDWEEVHNIHAGQTCIIIGNGPSLKDTPRELLDGYPTFGSNRCYLPGGYIPRYYVAVNDLLIRQFHQEIAEIHSEMKFIKIGYIDLIPGAIPVRTCPNSIFSTNPANRLYEGYTVTYVAMQLAYWMGFTTVLLVGCKHEYKQDGKPNERQRMEFADRNHFNPDYFKGSEWNLADVERMTASYKLAKIAYEADGRRIINLTPGSKLDVFERQGWDRWI